MDKIKVIITNKQKEYKIPTGIRLLMRRCCNAILTMEDFPGPAEICIYFVDDEEIHRLNKEFRNIDRSTDVLSFPLGENGKYDKNPETGAYMLGDVVISIPHAVAQAKEYGHSFRREVVYLTAHSVLHLLGYDHVNGGIDALNMREREEQVMNMLGLPQNEGYEANEEEF